MSALTEWWHRYAGSVAFVGLIMAMALGFWQMEANARRFMATEKSIAAERSERVEAILEARFTMREMELRAEQAAAERVAQRREEQQALKYEILRQSAIRDCERTNAMSRRLRDYINADLAKSRRLLRSSTDMRLAEFVGIMSDYETALLRLRGTLQRFDCSQSYTNGD